MKERKKYVIFVLEQLLELFLSWSGSGAVEFQFLHFLDLKDVFAFIADMHGARQ